MMSRLQHRQRGSTLLVSMIMLVAITLLVVFSIRSANTNLRITGNMQVQTEAHQATQQAIEQTLEEVIEADDPSLIAAKTVNVEAGAATYPVEVKAMNTCVMEDQVLNEELEADSLADRGCFADSDRDRAIRVDGTLTTVPSECKEQLWEVQAGIDDANTGASVHQVQGITIRVPSTVSCL